MAKRDVRSMRLVFSYEGRDVNLVSRQSVEMKSPVSDELQTREGQPGFWYELRDGQGRTLYRRITQNPIRYSAEVRSDDRTRPLEWQRKSEAKGTFVLHVPELEQARFLLVFSSPLEPAESGKPATEFARFDLQKGKEPVR